jgi:hypothetical protein
MRTSNKIILITLTVIFVITAVTIISIGIYFISDNPHLIKIEKGSKNVVSHHYAFEDFDAINASGFFKVKIRQDNGYTITVTAPEYVIKHFAPDVESGTLTMKQMFFTGIPPVYLDVSISMPRLKGIESDVSIEADFYGFAGETMVIDTTGHASIKGLHSHIHDVNISGSGVIEYDLDSCETVNATLAFTGNGSIDLNMAGGTLNGYVDGNIAINYRGSIGEQSIKMLEGAQLVRKDDQ